MKKITRLLIAIFILLGLVSVPKNVNAATGANCSCIGPGIGVNACTIITDAPDHPLCLGAGAIGTCGCSPDTTCGGLGQQACKAIPLWVQDAVKVGGQSTPVAVAIREFFLSQFSYDIFGEGVDDVYNRCRPPLEKFRIEGANQHIMICANNQEEANELADYNGLIATPAFNLCRQTGATTDPSFKKCVDCATSGGVYTAIGCVPTSRQGIVKTLLTLALGISGAIVLLRVLQAGFMLSTSQGEQNKVQEAREILTSSITGLLFIIFSMVLLNTIGVSILRIPGF